jgi:hypothetical protein
VSRDNEWLIGLSLFHEVVQALGDPYRAEGLTGLPEPHAGPTQHRVGPAQDGSASTRRSPGPQAATGGHRDLAMAIVEGAGADDRARAAGLLRSVLGRCSEPGMGTLRPWVVAAMFALETVAAEAPVQAATFRREGEVWAIEFERRFRLRDTKGLRYLSILLAHPGRELHALDLVAGPGGSAAPGVVNDAGRLGLHADRAGGWVNGPDAVAIAAYRDRLRELRAQAAEAERLNDHGRLELTRAETEAIERELVTGFGLGGRSRPGGSPAERARQSVTKALRDAQRRITAQDAALGSHLARTLRTGLYCVYDPDPAAAPRWRA